MSATEHEKEVAAGDMLAAALVYAGRGWPVFPVAGKVPVTARGFKDASTDRSAIRAWWDVNRGAGIGITTGSVSGLVVLDEDTGHGGGRSRAGLETRLGTLPATYTVLTGGGGRHFYFAHPGGSVPSSAGKLGAGLDVRADGGYVVAAPSSHGSGRRYKLLHDRELAELPARWLEAIIGEPGNGKVTTVPDVIPKGRRRAAMLTVAGRLKRAGLTGNEILPTLRELNLRCRPPLEDSELESVAHNSTIEPDAESAIRTTPNVTSQPVDAVLEVFRRWMHLPDPGVVLVTCAVVAANRVESLDPTWLILVGAAGSGKTEALSATGQLDGVHLVGTLTEPSLLSGTPRKDTSTTSTGGLLREIGDSGIIVLKDFGSILSMHRDGRTAVLAALRELFDGSWTRLIGVDGGRRLHWQGRLGLLAGATTVLDQHHGVMAQLGERFLIYRVNIDDASAQGRSSLAHHGREQGMRRELATAVAGLFVGLDTTDLPPLSDADRERLVSLAVLVARSRSPVMRDSYRREIEMVPDSEAPGRIVGALARLLTGLRLIGVDEGAAWRVTVKTGLDSMPAARRQALEFLLDRDTATTTEIATMLGLPNGTAHRVLEDLAAHALVGRESQGQGKADIWRIKPETKELYAGATSPEMSEEHLSSRFDSALDDFSGEVSR